MKISQHSVVIKASPQDVWNKLSDVENWPTWDKSLSWCKFSKSFAEGESGSLKPSIGPPTTFKLINVIDKMSFDAQSSLPLCNKMIIGHHLEQCKEGTRLTHSIKFEGWLSCLFERVIGNGLRASLPSAMDSLKSSLEQSRSSRF